jgi:arylsulfatase A-like enzyme
LGAVFLVLVATSIFPPLSLAQAKKVPGEAAKSPSDGPAAKKPDSGSEELKDGLIRELKKAFDAIDGLGDQDPNREDGFLRDADAALTRIREENRRALEQARRQVRIVDCHCPNIVLFLLNGVGYGDLGVYGQQVIKTPIADILAAQGTQFSQFYAGSCESVASRGTLYSGRLTVRSEQAGEDWITIRERDFTLAESLYQGGYETGLFGVWGAGPLDRVGHPNRQGFKCFFGYLDDKSALDFYPSTLWRNDAQVALTGNQGGAKTQYAPDLIVEGAKRFIDEECRRPFFLNVAFPMTISGTGQEVPDLNPYADQDWPTAEKTRAAMITRVDRYMGEIVQRLQERRVLNRTIVIITSDRGPPSAAEGAGDRFQPTGELRGRKGELYEGGIRVPLIVYWGGTPLAPAESDLCFGMWDLLPTLCDLTGTWHRPKTIDGVSVAKRLSGTAPDPVPPGSPLYWETHAGGLAQAARVGDWKGVRSGAAAPWELYDLKTDSAESTDVAGQHADVVERINELVNFLRP